MRALRLSALSVFLSAPAFAQTAPSALPPLPPPPVAAPAPAPAAGAAPAPASSSSAAPSPAPAPPPPPPAPPPSYAPPSDAAEAAPRDPTAHLHDGLYFRLGIGAAYVSSSEDSPMGSRADRGAGGSLWLALGGTPSPGLVLGGLIHGEAGTDGRDGHNVDVANVGIGPFVDWYPKPNDGWHIGAFGGLGGATWQIHGASTSYASAGLGGALFGGYDAWIGEQWSLGVMGVLAAATSAPLKDDNGVATGASIAPVSFAINGVLLLH